MKYCKVTMHENTLALIIGSGCFPKDPTSITAIPNVEVNVKRLQALFADQQFVGIPYDNIIVSINESKTQILQRLAQICDEAHDYNTVIIYYSGHGIMSQTYDYTLYLTTCESRKKYLEITSIRIDEFKLPIQNCSANQKIIILDCCHSGHLTAAMGEDEIIEMVNEQTKVMGTYVLTSASARANALFPADNPELPTYFTGELINLIESGVESKNLTCNLNETFTALTAKLLSHKPPLPLPQQLNNNLGGEIPFFINQRVYKIQEQTDWQILLNEGFQNIEHLNNYLQNYPNSEHAGDVSIRLENIKEEGLWQRALTENTIVSYSQYLGKTTKDTHIKETKKEDEKIK